MEYILLLAIDYLVEEARKEQYDIIYLEIYNG